MDCVACVRKAWKFISIVNGSFFCIENLAGWGLGFNSIITSEYECPTQESSHLGFVLGLSGVGIFTLGLVGFFGYRLWKQNDARYRYLPLLAYNCNAGNGNEDGIDNDGINAMELEPMESVETEPVSQQPHASTSGIASEIRTKVSGANTDAIHQITSRSSSCSVPKKPPRNFLHDVDQNQFDLDQHRAGTEIRSDQLLQAHELQNNIQEQQLPSTSQHQQEQQQQEEQQHHQQQQHKQQEEQHQQQKQQPSQEALNKIVDSEPKITSSSNFHTSNPFNNCSTPNTSITYWLSQSLSPLLQKVQASSNENDDEHNYDNDDDKTENMNQQEEKHDDSDLYFDASDSTLKLTEDRNDITNSNSNIIE